MRAEYCSKGISTDTYSTPRTRLSVDVQFNFDYARKHISCKQPSYY